MIRKLVKQKQAEEIPEGLAPLDEIRQVENQVAAQIALAVQEVEGIQVAAKVEAEKIRQDARERGKAAGEKLRQERLEQTRSEAAQIVQEASETAQALEREGMTRAPEAAQWVISLVKGQCQENVPK